MSATPPVQPPPGDLMGGPSSEAAPPAATDSSSMAPNAGEPAALPETPPSVESIANPQQTTSEPRISAAHHHHRWRQAVPARAAPSITQANQSASPATQSDAPASGDAASAPSLASSGREDTQSVSAPPPAVNIAPAPAEATNPFLSGPPALLSAILLAAAAVALLIVSARSWIESRGRTPTNGSRP